MFARFLLLLVIAFGLVACPANARVACAEKPAPACHCCPDADGAACCGVPQGPLDRDFPAATPATDAKQVPAPTLILFGLQPQLAAEPLRTHRPLAARKPAILDRICVLLI